MENIISIIVFAAVFLFVAITLYRRLGRNHSQPSRTNRRTNASDTGDTSTPMFFSAGAASHHDSGSGSHGGGDSGGGCDGGGGGGGE
jgi:uncharacterized membrane protein YgcG